MGVRDRALSFAKFGIDGIPTIIQLDVVEAYRELHCMILLVLDRHVKRAFSEVGGTVQAQLCDSLQSSPRCLRPR